jgi:hypothetical protein
MSSLRLTASGLAAHLRAAVHSGLALQHSSQFRRGEAAKVRQLFGDLAADKTRQPCACRMAFPCMKHICYKPGHRCLHVALPALGVVLVCSRVVTGLRQGAERVCRTDLFPDSQPSSTATFWPRWSRQGPANQICAGSKADGRLESCQSPSKLAGNMWRARCSRRDTSSRRRRRHALQEW